LDFKKTEVKVHSSVIGTVFGHLDENVRKIEKAFNVQIVNRGDSVSISGDEKSLTGAEAVFSKLTALVEKGENLDSMGIDYLIAASGDEGFRDIEKMSDDLVAMTISGKPVKPKTLGQKKYVDLIRKNTIVFGVGPAGTGKTYLAMAMAISAFKSGKVERIVLTRPAIEAGEKLGFLPGDLQQKVDPYLRPLYDALHEIMGAEAFHKNFEKGAIEVAPLAYMRGRTLNNAFIVLDEAQNTTPEQMKMFLTRIGFGSKAIITGDLTQIDLPDGKRCGLVDAIRVLEGIDDIGISHLTNKDVVRHPLVAKIVAAYEKEGAKKKSYEPNNDKKRHPYNHKGKGKGRGRRNF